MVSRRMTRKVPFGAVLLGTLVLCIRPSRAGVPDASAGDAGASFDCAKAASRLETMICGDGEASALDGQLAQVYRRLLSSTADPIAMKAEQRQWLREQRGKCADVSCVRKAYRSRLAELAAAEKAAPGGGPATARTGAPARRAHWVQIRVGSGAVCEAFRDQVELDDDALEAAAARRAGDSTPVGTAPGLVRPDWKEPDDQPWVPKDLKGYETAESRFDFDNDGVPDRVFSARFDSHYMQGSILFVQLGTQSKEPWYLPCQLDPRSIAVRDCPPFSQKYDEAALTMADGANRKVLFRGRYVDLEPLQLAGTTFILVETNDARTRNELAVIKPQAGQTFEPVCLLHREKRPREGERR